MPDSSTPNSHPSIDGYTPDYTEIELDEILDIHWEEQVGIDKIKEK